MNGSRKRKHADACSTHLKGKSRKVHQLRRDIQHGLREAQTGDSATSCLTCKPVLEQIKPIFQSFVRTDIELRHSTRVLPNPRKPNKLHYRNLVAQNEWIQSNLFDAVGNYRYCQSCINSVLQVGTQRLSHQRTIKRRQVLLPLVDMTKSNVNKQALGEIRCHA